MTYHERISPWAELVIFENPQSRVWQIEPIRREEPPLRERFQLPGASQMCELDHPCTTNQSGKWSFSQLPMIPIASSYAYARMSRSTGNPLHNCSRMPRQNRSSTHAMPDERGTDFRYVIPRELLPANGRLGSSMTSEAILKAWQRSNRKRITACRCSQMSFGSRLAGGAKCHPSHDLPCTKCRRRSTSSIDAYKPQPWHLS